MKKKFQKMLILAFEANSTLSHENETKIVKITHSDMDVLLLKIVDYSTKVFDVIGTPI